MAQPSFTISIDNSKTRVVVTEVSGDAIDIVNMQARVLRKLDWHLLPLIALLYFLSFMDRANIGNARIAGMATDLNLFGLRYNIAAAIFLVTYCLGQVPSNIILKLFRPSRWIPIIMVTWGLIMTLSCLVKTYPQLLITRVFLGLAEAGLVPGVTYYISLWYPRAERGKRIAIFVSAATVAGAFGGLLAYAIERMDGIGGLRGWQWIFCLEGLATVVSALAAPFLMYDYPETASFLTDAERKFIVELMQTDSQGLATHYHIQFVLQGLKDYKTYLQFAILFGFAIPGSAIAFFIPTIINGLGFSATHSQLLSIAPWAAGCGAAILFGIYSDKYQLRGPYVVAGGLVALVGCITLYTQSSPGVGLVGVVLATVGVASPGPIVLAWASSNAGGDVKRGVVLAIIISLASMGGIASSFIFFDPPRFHVGLGISIGLLGLSLLTCLFAMWHYDSINKQRERYCHEHGITDEHKEEFSERGDDSPLFRYAL